VTTGGSLAQSLVATPAGVSAPSVQKLLDLGAVIVGKQKLAQFASGADPWGWQDEHYPFNPRGDGWLTCSASSSGGGCSIAAYDWLDYAIGSDTGSSMRRPAAVAGVYGNRPSQGLMSLEGVMPLGGATDTAGVFSRDPAKWTKFAKAWYATELHQGSDITGLPALNVPDTKAYPKQIIYATDLLPLANPDAEKLLQSFLQKMQLHFNMTLSKQSLSAAIEESFTSTTGLTLDHTNRAINIIDTNTQYYKVAKPLKTAWAANFQGRFPPIDAARRATFKSFDESKNNDAAYADALETKAKAVSWFESKFLTSSNGSCSDSLLIYDIGTGGKPSYREETLIVTDDEGCGKGRQNGAVKLGDGKYDAMTGASICPMFGCVDVTVPIGQVGYQSAVTMVEEQVPVTVNLVMKRGCDFVLFNMVEEMGRRGILKSVKTGREAF
jgi:Asp-tRNA(Asn)/Glu-tRNA(Gln) amidotransferase A subunit family amidase